MDGINYEKWGAPCKVCLLAIVLFVVYDLKFGIFHAAFAWLGTTPTGASIGSHGVEWEWYFRSYLDHFSTLFGMIFALNMPFLHAWFKRVEKIAEEWRIKAFVGTPFIVAAVAWVMFVYNRPKGEYNNLHCYYGVIPLTVYLFFRNISPTVRVYYLHLLHNLGQITLETYLLQYHVWLTSNAGTLLNVVPGYPKLTYLIATAFHLFLARNLFVVTNDLRALVLPTDLSKCLRNLST